MTMVEIRHEDFHRETVALDTRMVNDAIIKTLGAIENRGKLPPAVIRRARLEGRGPFPLPPESVIAAPHEIDGPHGPVKVRIHKPADAPAGVYLHIHGGGWTLGSPRENDGANDRIVARTGWAVVSVQYRLAPEHPYPAAPDDCEAAALWLAGQAQERFGTTRLAIGGESAGANLAVATLLRLRERHGLTPFAGAMLNAGCFDLRLTPSARRFGETPLVLNTEDIQRFVSYYLSAGGDVESADISPLLGDLTDLPPALFVVGTRDPLMDDTLFMSTRWIAAGNGAELMVGPGGCHVFTHFPGTLTDQAMARFEAFLAGL